MALTVRRLAYALGAEVTGLFVLLTSIVPRTYLLARMLMELGADPPAR